MGLLWVGVVNTGLALLTTTVLTNQIGVPLMTTMLQGRPMLSEALLWATGGAALSLSGLIDLTVATVLLILAAVHINSEKR